MEEEAEQISEGSVELERIHYPHLQSSQALYQSVSMVAIRDTCFDHHDNRSVVFPPINHEGLHISSSSQPPPPPPPLSLFSHCDANVDGPPSPPSNSKPRLAGDVARWFGFGFELLRSKFTGVASSLRCYAASTDSFWSNRSTTGVALAAMLLSLLYMRRQWQRQHSRVRKDSKDHLILLIKEKDEKINQLLQQIAQMNQVLPALHRVPLSRTD